MRAECHGADTFHPVQHPPQSEISNPQEEIPKENVRDLGRESKERDVER